ncbi:MAG: hypothetical protein WCN88_00805 [Candidatus Falkowbacteria bacterium]
MDNEQIKKISLAFDIEEKSLIECLNKFSKARKAKKIRQAIPKEDLELELSTLKTNDVFYFLEEDYDKLNEKISVIKIEIERLGQEIAHSVDVSGETFHDNFVYEEGNRQQAMWIDEIRKLTAVKNQARVIDPQIKAGLPDTQVAIGKQLTLLVNGKTVETKIGSYLSFDKNSLSYASVFAKNIMNLSEGDHKDFVINHKKISLTVLKIY